MLPPCLGVPVAYSVPPAAAMIFVTLLRIEGSLIAPTISFAGNTDRMKALPYS
jgi:hypothetical protein